MKIGVFIIFVLIGAMLTGCGREKLELPPEKLEAPLPEKIAGVKREVFNAEQSPELAAVGRIIFIGRKWCSLTLVSQDIAVTAGHCFLESNLKLDLSKDLDPFWATVVFREKGVRKIENVSVKRVLKAEMNPDYAIVRLNRKITEIKPLKISALTLDEIRGREVNLGCAGFNGDKELGEAGWTMTISRNIRIVPETTSETRIDATCFSTYGGSGGLFFEEKSNAETNFKEYAFLGVVWGVTDERLDEKGKLIKAETVVTSITPVSAFLKELTEITGAK